MASYFAFNGVNLQKGAQGDIVKRIQEALNEQGNNLTVDGNWADNTDAAVRAFQQKSGLDANGVYDTKTHTALFGKSPAEKVKEEVGDFEYSPYTESESVTTAGTNATNAADAVTNYGDFSYGKQSELDAVIDKILNREDFSYDLNGDVLYQQYKDQYMTQGKLASQDVMGQAAAMTGGYGNSYASTAGNQAYQGYLQQLNDVIPELYQMAYDKYAQEGQDLYNQYGLLSDDRSTKYGEWSDGYNRAVADRDYYQGVYDSERSYDYGKWSDGRDFAYGQHRDAVTDDKWAAGFDEGVRQFNEQQAAKNDSSGGNTTTTSEIPDYIIKKCSELSSNTEIKAYLENQRAAGVITLDQSLQLMAKFKDVNEKYLIDEDGIESDTISYTGMVGSSKGWTVVYDGGINGGGGIDNNAVVISPNGETFTMKQLQTTLISEGMDEGDAKNAVVALQNKLRI